MKTMRLLAPLLLLSVTTANWQHTGDVWADAKGRVKAEKKGTWDSTAHFDRIKRHQTRRRLMGHGEHHGMHNRAGDQLHAIVIGTGFGGSAAAQSLAQLGVRVTMLEKLERVGGRSYVDCDSMCYPETKCVRSDAWSFDLPSAEKDAWPDCSARGLDWLEEPTPCEQDDGKCQTVAHPKAGECICFDMGCQWHHGIKVAPNLDPLDEDSYGIFHLSNFKYGLKNMASNYCNQQLLAGDRQLDQYEAFRLFIELAEWIGEKRDEIWDEEGDDMTVAEGIQMYLAEREITDPEALLMLKMKIVEVYELDAGDSIFNLSFLEGPPWDALTGADQMVLMDLDQEQTYVKGDVQSVPPGGLGALSRYILRDLVNEPETAGNVEILNLHEVKQVDLREDEGARVYVEIGAMCRGVDSSDDAYCASGATKELKRDPQRVNELRNRWLCETQPECSWQEGTSQVFEADLVVAGTDVGHLKRYAKSRCRQRKVGMELHENHTMDQDHRNGGVDLDAPPGGWTRELCEAGDNNEWVEGLFVPPLPNGPQKSIDNITFGTLNKVGLLYDPEQMRYANNKEYNLYIGEDHLDLALDLNPTDNEDGWAGFFEAINMNLYYDGGMGGEGELDSCVVGGVEQEPESETGVSAGRCAELGGEWTQAFNVDVNAPYPMITIFATEPMATVTEGMTEQEVFDRVVDMTNRLFPGIGNPKSLVRSYWTEWLGGSYTSTAAGMYGGTYNRFTRPYFNGRLWFVGEHTDYDWFGFLHGAWKSGHERAESVHLYWECMLEHDDADDVEDCYWANYISDEEEEEEEEEGPDFDLAPTEGTDNCPHTFCQEYEADSCSACEAQGGFWHYQTMEHENAYRQIVNQSGADTGTTLGVTACVTCNVFNDGWEFVPHGAESMCPGWCPINRPFEAYNPETSKGCRKNQSEDQCEAPRCPMGTCAVRLGPCCAYKCIPSEWEPAQYCADGKLRNALRSSLQAARDAARATRGTEAFNDANLLYQNLLEAYQSC